MIDSSAQIHPSSVIEDGAIIGTNCQIGPFCHIGPKVVLGDGVICYSHVVIAGRTEIGDETRIYPFASVGHHPQDLKYADEDTGLIIGRRNKIRESTSINLGTIQDAGVTRIGDDNLFMIGAHIGHDCQIGNGCIFANNAAVSGHVKVDDGVIVGGQVGIIQFARIGKGAMLGAGSMVSADVIPYGLTVAERPWLHNLNIIGLKRRGAGNNELRALKTQFEGLFNSEAGLRKTAEAMAAGEITDPYLAEIVNFILAESDRSFLTPRTTG